MKVHTQQMILLGALALITLAVAAFAFSPVQAFHPGDVTAMQTTPLPGDPVVTGIPDTGADANQTANLSWVIWAILGISLLALLIALVSRGTTRSDV